MISAQPVKGMRDFMPAEVTRREEVLSVIRREVTCRGFLEIETPAIESMDRLKSKQGGENEAMLFEILRRGLAPQERLFRQEAVDLGLRYDLTLPLSRYYANNHGALPKIFRCFQAGWVWRAERPQKGRFRQFQQCDIDIVGDPGIVAEIEAITVGWSVIKSLGLAGRATLLVNDRRLLDWLMDKHDIAADKRTDVLIALDKKGKISSDDIAAEMVRKNSTDAKTAKALLAAIERLSRQREDSKTVEIAGVSEPVPSFNIAEVISTVKGFFPTADIVFEPSLVRGMGYYTGLIFEVTHADSSSSICGGGRYDEIIGKWVGSPVPAVGFSVGFERIMGLLENTRLRAGKAVALGYTNDAEYLQALRCREELVAAGYDAGVVATPKKPKKFFFEQLVQAGYSRIIFPDGVGAETEYSLSRAKELKQ